MRRVPPENAQELARENERLRGELDRLRGEGAGASLAAGELDEILRGLGILVFTFDAQDRFVEYRARRDSDLYVPPEAFVGRRVDEVIPPPLGARMLEAVRRVRDAGVPELLAYPLGPRDYEARLVPLAHGRVTALVLDVSERKRAEDALRASEERFRALTERATDLLAVTDAEGRYTFWSAGATEALGWGADEMLGRGALDHVHPDDLAEVQRALGELLRSPGTVVIRERYRHRDGGWRTLDVHGRNLLSVPAVAGIVVNARDVTEQVRLEEQVREAQRLESVGRLAGGVAHDFNNLLTVILSCAEELSHRGPAASMEEVSEIRTAAERARDLTRQLLTFARRQILDPRPLDLNALVQEAERLLRRMVGEDVDVAVNLAPGLWPVRADPTQLRQVLVNLAANARDAMPRGGKLTIETSNVVLDGSREGAAPGPYVLLAVSDSGEGMTAEARSHAFEPFFTTKPVGRGTGLGLAAVYGVVKQSGGHIWLYSEPGQGTTFKLHFPRAEEAPQRPAHEVATPPPGGSETVLVVEDDPGVREVTVRALRGAGYDVLAAGDPRQAFALAERAGSRVRLLVTDVVLPERSGREVADALARTIPGLGVLYVSGYTRNTIEHHGVLDSGVEFLPKPFTGSALLARVRAILDRR